VDWASEQDTALRLTELGSCVLEDTRPPLDSRVVHAALLIRLDECGLLTPAESIRRAQFSSEFLDRYGFLNRDPSFLKAISPKGVDILVRKLATKEMRSALHNLLLVDWLFGTWDAFNKYCLWQSVMDCKELHSPVGTIENVPTISHQVTRRAPPSANELHTHRRVCLDFLEQNKTATRSRFSQVAPASLRWMLQFDETWLNKYLPTSRIKSKQKPLF
jgi:hypothetical protein